jgi:hypothetical protein
VHGFDLSFKSPTNQKLLYAVIMRILDLLQFDQHSVNKRYLVIDDSPIPKRDRKIENVSFIYDHNLGRSILGFSIVTIGLFTGKTSSPWTSPIDLEKHAILKAVQNGSETPELSAAK